VGLRAGLEREAREKILYLCQDRTPVIQFVLRRYTDTIYLWSEVMFTREDNIKTHFRKQIYITHTSYGSTAQIGPWPSLLGFRNNNLFTWLDC
jgi:hypothetical protein